MPERVYLAARYSRLEEMQAVREQLRELGYEVTSRWVNGDHQAENDDPLLMREFAIDDLADLRRADMVISFQETPRQPSTNRGGRHVEFGYALAMGKVLYAVGPLEHVFTALPEVHHYASWPDLLQHLGWLQWQWPEEVAGR